MRVKYTGPDFPGALIHGRTYAVIGEELGHLYRIIDESGEDYLYDKGGFVEIEEEQ